MNEVGQFVVICREDTHPNGDKGEYVVASRRLFVHSVAADEYAATVHPSREPRVVSAAEYLFMVEGWRVEPRLTLGSFLGLTGS